jgi:hypothetical protein
MILQFRSTTIYDLTPLLCFTFPFPVALRNVALSKLHLFWNKNIVQNKFHCQWVFSKGACVFLRSCDLFTHSVSQSHSVLHNKIFKWRVCSWSNVDIVWRVKQSTCLSKEFPRLFHLSKNTTIAIVITHLKLWKYSGKLKMIHNFFNI